MVWERLQLVDAAQGDAVMALSQEVAVADEPWESIYLVPAFHWWSAVSVAQQQKCRRSLQADR